MAEKKPGLADLNTQTQLLLCVSSHSNLDLFVQSQLFLG